MRGSVRPEKIVIKRTETKDEYGRTTSITTETIRTLGSYDLVKRETEDVLQPPPQIYQSNGENELDSILEEDESTDSRESRTTRTKKATQRTMSPVRSILKSGDGKRPSNKEKKVILVGDDDEISDGGSIYSDAYDTLPSKLKSSSKAVSKSALNAALKQTAPSKPAAKSMTRPQAKSVNPSMKSITQSGMSQSINRSEQRQKQQGQPQQPLDQQQMYDIAYKVAMEKVYGGEREFPEPPKAGGFKSYSLRGDNPMSKKGSASSQKLSLSRTNSISSLTQRFLPSKSGKKEKSEVETHRSEDSFEGFESTNVQNLASPERVIPIDSTQSINSQQLDVGTNAALTNAALTVDTSTRETNADSPQSRRTDSVSENAGQSHEVSEQKNAKKHKKKSIALATFQKAFGHPGLKHMYPEHTETHITKQEEVKVQEPALNTNREAIVESYAHSQEPAVQETFGTVETEAHEIQEAVGSHNSKEEEEEEEEQKDASSSAQRTRTREQTGFALHTMRDVIHKENKATEAPKNYNTQLHGHFETIDAPAAKDDRTDGSTLMAENGISESDIHEYGSSGPVHDTLKNPIGQSAYTTQPTNAAESTTTKPKAVKEKKKLTFKRLISFKF